LGEMRLAMTNSYIPSTYDFTAPFRTASTERPVCQQGIMERGRIYCRGDNFPDVKFAALTSPCNFSADNIFAADNVAKSTWQHLHVFFSKLGFNLRLAQLILFMLGDYPTRV